MNRKAASIFCALMIGASLITRASDLPRVELPVSSLVMQNDVTITCPDRVTYQVHAIPEWNAGMHSIKQMQFEDATVSGRTLNCNYSGPGGGDWSVLMREMPAGYICTTKRIYGTKNRQFLCKRAVAPIKIKPKTD